MRVVTESVAAPKFSIAPPILFLYDTYEVVQWLERLSQCLFKNNWHIDI